MTEGIVIEDGTQPGGAGGLSFDLADVLHALGEAALDASRTCSELRYVAHDDRDIDMLERAARGAVPGRDLANGLDRLSQVIDGDSEATNAAGERWALVRAIDSSWWEVWSDDPAVLHNVRSAFRFTVTLTTFTPRCEIISTRRPRPAHAEATDVTQRPRD